MSCCSSASCFESPCTAGCVQRFRFLHIGLAARTCLLRVIAFTPGRRPWQSATRPTRPGKRTKKRCRWWLALFFLRSRQLPRHCQWWLALLAHGAQQLCCAGNPAESNACQPAATYPSANAQLVYVHQ